MPSPKEKNVPESLNAVIFKGYQGFEKQKVKVYGKLHDNVFLTRTIDGKGYAALDAETGLLVGNPKKTKELAAKEFASKRDLYERAKKNHKSSFKLKANERGVNGWKPIEEPFDNVNIKTAYKGVHSWKEEEDNVSTQQNKLATKYYMDYITMAWKKPTIVKAYGTDKNNIDRVTAYSKTDRGICRKTFYKKGKKTPKGSKLLFKRFLKGQK